MSQHTLRFLSRSVLGRSSSSSGSSTLAPQRAFTRSFTRTCFRNERVNPLDKMAVRRAHEQEIGRLKGRMRVAGLGLAFSFIGLVVTTTMYPAQPVQSDAPADTPDFGSNSSSTTTTTTHVGPANVDLVDTGTSTVPHFPRTIVLPARESTKSAALPSGIGDAESQYTLLGLGIRTVSFLSIQVYVVGIYVANNDLAALQAAFVKEGAGTESATALIAGEKDGLRKKLLDPEEGEKIWERVLTQNEIRSVIRIVPVRSTDFAHLRDGFERNINARVRTRPELAEDDGLGAAVGDFKAMFGKAKLAKGEEVLLERGRRGELRAWFRGAKDRDGTSLGRVDDERISRLMLLGYLAGKKVASEPCRQSVIDGVIHVVERPVGTAETEVL